MKEEENRCKGQNFKNVLGFAERIARFAAQSKCGKSDWKQQWKCKKFNVVGLP